MSKNKKTDSSRRGEIIDIYQEPDLVLTEIETDNPYEFRIEMEGPSIDHGVVNAVRRSISMYVPVYAFNRINTIVDFKKSKHMYNNDLIYNQLETLPIFDVPNLFDLENPKIFLPTEVFKKLFGNFIPEKYTYETETEIEDFEPKKKLLKIELLINYKNETALDKYLTTHDVVLKIDGKISKSYLNRDPISILVLKPNEELHLKSEANLGINKIHGSYEATTIVVHNEITPTKYVLWYETLGQLDKKVIFVKACIILMKKLENLRNFLKENYKDKNVTSQVEIELYGEDHTIGVLLETVLQRCEKIMTAAYNMPHLFIDKVIIMYQIFDNVKENPIEILKDCISYLIKIFQFMIREMSN